MHAHASSGEEGATDTPRLSCLASMTVMNQVWTVKCPREGSTRRNKKTRTENFAALSLADVSLPPRFACPHCDAFLMDGICAFLVLGERVACS